MSSCTVQVQERTESFINLPDEMLPAPPGTKFTCTVHDDGSMSLTPFASIDIDMDDDIFMMIAKLAHENDITFNEMAADILAKCISTKKDI